MIAASSLAQQAADLPVEAVAGLGAIAAFLLVLAVGAQLAARRLQLELQDAQEELVDRTTGLLPRSALRVRLGAELAWAATSNVPVAVAALRVRGAGFTQAARVLRHAMREEESAFLLGEQRVAVELWDTDPAAAATATRRLGDYLARAGHPVVDIGVACSPRDGSDVETLLAAAQRDLRPADDPLPPGHDIGRDGRMRGAVGHATALLAGVLPWFAAMCVLLLVAWRLVPAAIDPVLGSDAARSATDWAFALVTVLGLPLGAALLHASCWNLGGRAAPRSRPLERAGLRSVVVLALVVALPLAWGVLAPGVPAAFADGFGASLAVVALVLLALVHARQLVHAPAAVLAPLAVAGAVVTWLAVEAVSWPVVANGGRLLAAAALGALLARYVERASWLVMLTLLAAGVDAWSVLTDQGVTSQLLDASGESAGGRLVDLLLFEGPVVGGTPLFLLGVTDVVFLALFLAWSHDWRLDMRVVAGALLGCTWAAFVAGEIAGEAIPVLPFVAVGMLLVVLVRTLHLRARSAAWQHEVEDGGSDAAGTGGDAPAAGSTTPARSGGG